MTARRLAIVSLVLLASCSSSDSETTAPTTTIDSVVDAPADTATDTTSDTTSTDTATTSYGADWETVTAPADCMCFDGSPYSFHVREADPSKVLFYLEGGGACFTAQMCATGSDTFKQDITSATSLRAAPGIFDFANPENPFADYSVVYVPYCTGDVHSGNLTKDYGNGVTIEHKGFVNASNALDTMVERFPDATRIVVAGSSAGSFPTPVFAALAGDRLPAANLKVFADSSGAIPDAMGLVASNWGTLDALPDWPEIEGLTINQFTPAYTFVKAAEHNPRITFARHDFAFDRVLSSYATMAGLSSDDLVDLMKANESKIEATGANVANWISPGDEHTIAVRDEFYTEEMNGVRFVEWLSAFLDDDPQADNYCVNCTS